MMGSDFVALKRTPAGRLCPHPEKVLLVQATVSHVLGIPLQDLCAATRRGPKTALARQVAMYLCHVVFARSIAEVARAFGRDPSTVTHAVRRIEEMRDDSEFDRSLALIEALLNRSWENAR